MAKLAPIYLLSTHGRVLALLQLYPGISQEEMAGRLALSSRTVAKALDDMVRVGYLAVEDGTRPHVYTPLPHERLTVQLDAGARAFRALMRRID